MSYNTRIKLKSDTEANWLSQDPVLLDGEIAIVRLNDGETRKKIGDGTKKFSELSYDGGDFVEYTAQTLTDEQKQQARENIGAADPANGLHTVDCILPKGASNEEKTIYTKNGIMLPLDYSVATGDMKTAILWFAITLNASSCYPSSIDPTVQAFATLIENGVFGDDFYSSFAYPSNQLYLYDSPFSPNVKITLYSYYTASDSRKAFVLYVTYANGNKFSRVYNPITAEYVNNYIDYVSRPLAETASESGDTPSLQQVKMSAAPTTDMQIATKKYVDDATSSIAVPSKASDLTNDAFVQYTEQTLTDNQKQQARKNIGALDKTYIDSKITDKELILSSSTEGSTKKFKLTIDDTGTLTASEITA